MRLPIFSENTQHGGATALIHHAIKKGIHFFDVGTFYCHDQCEKIFGTATGSLHRRNLVISGKNSTHQDHRTDWLQQLQHSLSLFRRKYFDLYLIHYLKLDTWKSHFIEKGIIDQIQYARRRGLFRHLGFSSHDTPDNVCELIDTGYFGAVQLPYNLLQRDYEKTMQYGFRQGLGIIVMNPLAGGALAKYHFFKDAAIHDEKQKPAAIALNYVLSQPFVHTVLSGMESEKIMDENIPTVHSDRYDSREIERLKNMISHEKRRIFVPCTSCGYCLPCTQGIPVPDVIRIYNNYAILKGQPFFNRDYSELRITPECCIGCEVCVDRCPHGIAIPDIMEKAVQLFRN